MKWLGTNTFCAARVGTLAAVIFGFALVLTSHPAMGADLARLRNGFTIRHEHRQVLGETTRLFLGPDNFSFIDVKTAEIEGFEKDLSLPAHTDQTTDQRLAASKAVAPAVNLSEIVNSASAARHLDPDLVNSVIHAESGFNARAVSPKGAQGLMQLMPSTAGQLGVRNAFDPEANVGGGTQYLRQLLEQYNFDLVKALAAYNAGPQRVEKYRGVPPYRETRAYVARIVREYNKKKEAEEKQGSRKSGNHVPQQAPAAVAPGQSTR